MHVAWILLGLWRSVHQAQGERRRPQGSFSPLSLNTETSGDGTCDPVFPSLQACRFTCCGQGEVPGRPWAPALASLTFLAVMFVVVEDKAAATLALVAAKGVDTVLLAASVILGALVLVCRGANKGRAQVCAGLRSGGHPRGSGRPGWASSTPPPPGAGWGVRGQGDDRVQLWGEKVEVGWREGWIWS